MQFIIDEYREAKNLLIKKDFKIDMAKKIFIVLKYMVCENPNIEDSELVRILNEVLLKSNNRNYKSSFWEDKMFKMIASIRKNDMKPNRVDSVKISKVEMDFINEKSLTSAERRLLFVMLIYAKMFNREGWIYCDRSCFLKDSKVSTNVDNQIKLLYKLKDKGYIQRKEYANDKATRVTYIDYECKEVAIEITDYYDLLCWLYSYDKGKTPFACEICGNHFFRKSNAMKYCPKCAREKDLEHARNYKDKVRK